ncbi:MAG TPA: endospore germination permease [Bacillales bacterium]|nr:endospore germination permease [Bacillales bacterium]
MKPFEYSDREIGNKEMAMAVSSILVGAGTLTFPRLVARFTTSADGWISIIIAGAFAVFFAWLSARLASRFPNTGFLDYTTKIVTKPVACVITFLFAIHFLLVTSYAARGIASASKMFMLPKTPTEVIVFTFLLVVSYCVIGSRAALLRVNLFFFPMVALVIVIIQLANIRFFEPEDLLPVFATDWTNLFRGAQAAYLYFAGYTIVLFYSAYMNKPRDTGKMTVYGVLISFGLYVLIYIFAMGILSPVVSENTMYPTLAVAKSIRLPGDFLIRFESAYFAIFMMTIFNTASMAFDVTVICLGSLFHRVKKIVWVLILAPIMFMIAMIPQSVVEMAISRTILIVFAFVFSLLVPACLLMIAKFRGVGTND